MNISPDKLFNILAEYATDDSGALPCEDFEIKMIHANLLIQNQN